MNIPRWLVPTLSSRWWAVITVACLAGTTLVRAQGTAPDVWPKARPEEVGLDSGLLAEMIDFAKAREIPVHSVQIARHGKLVLDAYFYPYAPGLRHDLASATKSMTSTLVGLAIEKGKLPGVKQPLLKAFPDRTAANPDARKQSITIEDLLTMQAGWDCGFEPNEARLFEMRRSSDWLQFMLDLPMVAEPGTRWAYCSGNCHVLSILLSQATGSNALSFARRELFAPLGIQDAAWHADPRGNNYGWGDLQLHPTDMAKIGQLLLQQGRWGERQVISKEWIQIATRAHVKKTSNNDQYGYFWWVKGDDFPGMFEAVGRGGQRINVWPAKDMVIVFTGGGFEPGDLAAFILKALKSDEALPPNAAAFSRLQEKLSSVLKPPALVEVPALPEMAGKVSGRKYQLTSNGPGMETFSLEFNASAEAGVKLGWLGQSPRIPIGLDGVERFSTNHITGLPQAAKGRWLDAKTFQMELDLAGGINFYRIKFVFEGDGGAVKITLNERTGLNGEEVVGVAVP